MISQINLTFVFWYAIIALAVWRTSSLFSREDGPMKIFRRIRVWVYLISLKKVFPTVFQSLSEGLACLWCNSVWFAMLYSVILANNIVEWFILSLSLSTFAIIIEEVTHHG